MTAAEDNCKVTGPAFCKRRSISFHDHGRYDDLYYCQILFAPLVFDSVKHNLIPVLLINEM